MTKSARILAPTERQEATRMPGRQTRRQGGYPVSSGSGASPDGEEYVPIVAIETLPEHAPPQDDGRPTQRQLPSLADPLGERWGAPAGTDGDDRARQASVPGASISGSGATPAPRSPGRLPRWAQVLGAARPLLHLLPLLLILACLTRAGDPAAIPPGFDRARAAFRGYAAEQMNVPTDEVEVMPGSEAIARTSRLGALWRFTAFGPPMEALGQEGPRQDVAGWATDDGRIINPDRDLGRLLAEAGLFGPEPPAPEALAELLLVPAIGARVLFVNDYRGAAAPSYQRRDDGAIELAFVVRVRSRIPGPIPERFERYRVVARSPADATLQIEPWTPER